LIDEFTIHYSPVFFGEGLPLFAGMSNDIKVKIKKTVASREVTHITYEVEK
jgi:dihydrofolate reductase